MKLKKFPKFVTRFALCALSFLAMTPAAGAASLNLNEIDLKPLVSKNAEHQNWFVENLKPGKSISEQLAIANLGTKTKTISLYVSDSVATGKAGSLNKNFFVKNRNEISDDLAPWVKLETTDLTLQPHTTKTINITISTSANAKSGLHAGAIMALEENSAGSLRLEKGVRVYVNIQTASAKQAANPNALAADITSSNLSSDLFNNLLPALLLFALCLILAQKRVTKKLSVVSSALIHKIAAMDWHKNISLIGFIATGMAISFSLFSINTGWLKTDVVTPAEQPSAAMTSRGQQETSQGTTMRGQDQGSQKFPQPDQYNFVLTAAFGNLSNYSLPQTSQKTWKGKMTFHDAKISIKKVFNFEPGDEISITDSNIFEFNLTTNGKDYDGIYLNIVPTSKTIPAFDYEETNDNQTASYKLSELLTTPGWLTSGTEKTYFKLDAFKLNEGGKIQEFDPTKLDITPESQKQYDLTKQKEQEEQQVLTQKLQELALPADKIQEIISSTQTSLIYPPKEKIIFPPQEFSFTQSQAAWQELGTIVVAVKSGDEMNTYISASDLVSVSAKNTIPVSQLTVEPGEVKNVFVFGNMVAKAGEKTTFKDKNDKVLLLNIIPGYTASSGNKAKKTIVTINPKLKIAIPPGTPAGKYHGTLTITSL